MSMITPISFLVQIVNYQLPGYISNKRNCLNSLALRELGWKGTGCRRKIQIAGIKKNDCGIC